VKPLLEVTKQEEKLTQKEDELRQVKEKLDVQLRSSQEYERKMQQVRTVSSSYLHHPHLLISLTSEFDISMA
jgi:hypothetical protein